MGARIARAAPWGVLAGSLAGCGVFGPAGLNAAVFDMLSVWALLISLGWLAVRGVRRARASRRWRRGGGRVIAQDGPTIAELAARLGTAEERARHNEELARSNSARLDDHERAWAAISDEDGHDARRRQMHAVRDDAQGA